MGTRTVILTGASSGIGAATATELSKAGARLVLVARSAERLERLAQTLSEDGATVVTAPGDIGAPEHARRVVELAMQRFGQVDAVVNNAAVIEPIRRIGACDLEEWTGVVRTDLLGPVALLRFALPPLLDSGGRVLNVISTAAHVAVAGLSAYSAAKAGLIAFSRVLAVEEPKLTVLMVQPGPVDTGMHVSLRASGDQLDHDRLAYYQQLADEGGLRSPVDTGRDFAWLALNAPNTWSGREIEPDDPDLRAAVDEGVR